MRHLAPSVVLAAALAGCGGTSPKPAPIEPASSTGFMALATTGTTQKLYLRAQAATDPLHTHAQLAVVNAAAANNTVGIIGFIDLGEDGSVQTVGASGREVVAVDQGNRSVYFVNAGTDTLRGTSLLPAQAQPILASDNAALSMGVAVDAVKRRAWVSVDYGLVEYDLDTFATTDEFNLPTPENFAYDPAGRIYAPFYMCEPVASQSQGTCVPYSPLDPGAPAVTDSLAVIDLHATPSPKIYTLEDPLAVEPHTPLGPEPDAVAVDTALGVAVVAIEGGAAPALQVLDLAKAQYHATNPGTCSIPPLVASVAMPIVNSAPAVGYTGVGADSDTHLAVVAQEYDVGVVFLDLAQAKKGGPLVPLWKSMPLLPDGMTPWRNRGDPHATTVGMVGGKPYAFLVTVDDDWIARIDLRGVAAIMAGTSSASFDDQVSYIQVTPPP
jgi:hypothetical protein